VGAREASARLDFLLLSPSVSTHNHKHEATMLNDKEKLYHAHITRSLAEMYHHMESMLKAIPDDIDEKDLTEDQLEVISRVEAIEQEWIIDETTRAEISLLDWIEDDK